MNHQLSKEILPRVTNPSGISVPAKTIFDLPEKVIQFGTGALLRGLPDYFIDKANKLGLFNGRIVVVKSTGPGAPDVFAPQDNLYTQVIRGLTNGVINEQFTINASISRVLSASSQWKEALECASNPEMEIVISNTTEVGICLTDDHIDLDPPNSYPGKLLAFLYARYQFFKGDRTKGMVIVPTELITGNGDKLLSIVKSLAESNNLENSFVEWLDASCHFCNSLVDRIVPNTVPDSLRQEIEGQLGYHDQLMITSEVYNLWAIETKSKKIKAILSFEKADEGVVIAEDITSFRELKLRLLNGSHTFNCALAFLSGFETVKEAMENTVFSGFVERIMFTEISPSIINKDLTREQAETFSRNVLERFRNPYIDHKWLAITLNFSSKMAMRNASLIFGYSERFGSVPSCMSLGFASFLLFMKGKPDGEKYYGEWHGKKYLINDESAGYFAGVWSAHQGIDLVVTVLRNTALWGSDLNQIQGLAESIWCYLEQLHDGNPLKIMEALIGQPVDEKIRG